MSTSQLCQNIIASTIRYFNYIDSSSYHHHHREQSSQVRIFAHLVAGCRHSRKTSLLEEIHANTSATKSKNHFHSGGTPSQLTEMSLNVERRIEYLRNDRSNKEKINSAEHEYHLLVVTIDDFDTIAALQKMRVSGGGAGHNKDDDDHQQSSGAGRFAPSASNNNVDSSSALRDLWGCLFDFAPSCARSRHQGTDAAGTTSFQRPTKISILLVATVAVSSASSRIIQQRAPIEEGSTSSTAPILLPSSVLSSSSSPASASLWIFPEALAWELKAQTQSVTTAPEVVPLSPSAASSALPLSTIARRSGCGIAFDALRETIFRFALHTGIHDAARNDAGKENHAAAAVVIGAVALSLQPPSGVLLVEQQHAGRADLVAQLGVEYVKRCCHGMSTLTVDAPLLFGPIFGETEERVRGAFADAYAARPCVLVIRNVEAVAASRGSVTAAASSSSSSSSGNVLQRAVATFLCEADGVDRPDRASSVLLVATTSRRGELDDAALRPGRLEQHLFLSSTLHSDQGGTNRSTDDVGASSSLSDPLSDSIESFIEAWNSDDEEQKEMLRACLMVPGEDDESNKATLSVDQALRVAERVALDNLLK